MTFTPAFLDELRARVPLPDVIGRRVRLIKRGREYVALCPFHNEKTPSLTVNEEKGFFHCFGCEAHGDVIGFVMQTENLSFPEAVERLAGEAGLEVPKSTPEERAKEQRAKTLYEVVEAAAAWFEAQLKAEAGKSAREYLKSRGVGRETATAFRLGYAPSGRTALKGALTARGVDEKLLVEAGIASASA
jgi:DNA primase